MVEQYEPWQPLESTDGELSIVWFEHRPATGVVLEVERLGGGPILRIWFDDAIAFREHPHDIMMLKWWGCGSLFRVRDSEWAAWLCRQSQGIWQPNFAHYGVRTVDGCYEVLTGTEPRAEWVAPEQSLNPAARGNETPSQALQM